MMMSKTTTKKNVSFISSEDVIHHIDSSVSLIGKDCISELWFTSNDQKRIQLRALRLCRDLNKKSNSCKKGDALRGLEFFYDVKFQRAARIRRSKSRTAVVKSWEKMLQEYYSSPSSLSQENERRRNELDIACNYSSISEDAVQHAIIQAQYDRNYVLECEIDELMIKRQQKQQQQQQHVIGSKTTSSTTIRRKRKNPFDDDDDNVFSTSTTTQLPPAFRKRQFATVAC